MHGVAPIALEVTLPGPIGSRKALEKTDPRDIYRVVARVAQGSVERSRPVFGGAVLYFQSMLLLLQTNSNRCRNTGAWVSHVRGGRCRCLGTFFAVDVVVALLRSLIP